MNYVSPCLSPELNNPKKKSKSFKNWTVILFPSSQRILIGPKVPQYNIQNVRDTQYVKNPGKSGQFSRKKKKIKSCLTQDDPDVGLSDSGLTAAIMIFFHMVKVNSLEIKDKTEVFNWKSKEQKFKNIKQQQNLLRFISLEPKKERSKRQTAKKNWGNNNGNLPKYSERFKFTDSRSSMNYKQDKLTENQIQIHN